MTARPRLLDLTVCDDVRQEQGGKLILVGVYTDTVVVFKVPTRVPSLTLILKWEASKDGLPSGEYNVKRPDGTVALTVSTQACPGRAAKGKIFTILQAHPFDFTVTGRYQLQFRPTGGKPRVLSGFDVVHQPARARNA